MSTTARQHAGESGVSPSSARYESATGASRDLWSRAERIFPQGVSGQAKFFSPYPVFVESAQGAHVTDVNGRDYVDLLMGAGPLLLGHGHPAVVEAIRRQVGNMINPMMPSAASIDYAERLQTHMPHLERLRFANTGSEATRSAVRVARAATGRLKIAKFEGNYHGCDDTFLVSTHNPRPCGCPRTSRTCSRLCRAQSRVCSTRSSSCPTTTPQTAAAIIAEHGSELAAVIMEPVSFSSGGGVPATREFAAAVRAATAAHGIVLIFDEVLCALRLGLAGAPAYLGVTPDLVCIGKAVGGGLPLAAFGGTADLMDATLGAKAGGRKIFQSGTFTENPLSVAAGAASLTVLETEDALERANAAGERLRAGLRTVLGGHETTGTVTGVGSIVQVHLGIANVSNRRDVLAGDLARTAELLLGLRG